MRRSHGPPWLKLSLLALAGGLLLLGTVATTEPSKPQHSGLSAGSFPVEEEKEENKPDYDPGKRSLTMDCAPGSRNVGLNSGYVRHVQKKLRLCALPISSTSDESNPQNRFYVEGAKWQALVSAPASYNYMQLIRHARRAGITLSATSSFRTMQHQTELWNSSDKSGRWVATPGGSNHQQAAAVDIAFSTLNTHTNCRWRSGVCTLAGNPTWDWLNANAQKFGIYQYSDEFWHFSPSGN